MVHLASYSYIAVPFVPKLEDIQLDSINLTRRELMMTGGGIVIAKLGLTSPVVGEDTQAAAKDLIFHTTKPRNGEPNLTQLVQSWITPVKHFYVRSHAPNPTVDINQFELTVEGKVRKPLTLSFAQLNRLTRRTVTATLTCAGNRRTEFNQEGKVGGVQWEAGAIGNAQWSGFALADVLKMAEVLEGAKHVWFEGLDKIQRNDATIPFGGSIPIEKAMLGGDLPGALLVDRMNGEALTPDHGYPLRTIVPGYIGARSVKWLGKIVVSDMPSPNHYLAHAYKVVKSTDPIDWTEAGPIYRYPINGAIASPQPAATIRPGWLNVLGYVLPTGHPESKIRQVEISTDDGLTWRPAKTIGQSDPFCWQLWKARIRVTRDTQSLSLRALDTSGGFMPQRAPWNAKGYLQNSWYRLPVKVTRD